ncbi:MAG: helix-turn-helix transcriptional regulator [Clostridia bacterium]|nr:helix-turn-helix transcriptional regulator [Clostridia bacterium]
MNTIGQRIRDLRKKNDLTQEKLADYLGVTYKSVSKWECGLTTLDLALIGPLTKILHVSADELLGLCPEETDAERQKYDKALQKYHDCEITQLNYAWARAALIDFPDDYRYMEWLAYAEYQLAFEECQKASRECSAEFLTEMTDNALRRYDTIIANCTQHEIKRKAVMGKIIVLRFCERIDEAEWSAQFEYPDPDITKAADVMKLSKAGRDLLQLLEKETASEKHS